jgi:pimeloyl-ACP methyl ester carboxylesterase
MTRMQRIFRWVSVPAIFSSFHRTSEAKMSKSSIKKHWLFYIVVILVLLLSSSISFEGQAASNELVNSQVDIPSTSKLAGLIEGRKSNLADIPLLSRPTLAWNSFVGGGGNDESTGIAVDDAGNIYMAGYSDVTWGTPIQPFSGWSKMFVNKFDANGNLIWHTFVDHGQQSGGGSEITLDQTGNIYVAGQGSGYGFAAKLDPNGNLLWLSGVGGQAARGIAIDNYGNVYVAGRTDFSEAPNAFVTKLDVNGVLVWNGILGSPAYFDEGTDVAVDTAGNVYVTGRSNSSWGLPVRPKSGSTAYSDGFVAKLTPDASLLWNTFLGRDLGFDGATGVAINNHGNLYVAGESNGTWGSPVQPFHGYRYNAFVAHINSGGGLQWNTFVGGRTEDTISTRDPKITVDSSGDTYLTGKTNGDWDRGFGSHTGDGYNDAFVAKVSAGGSLVWNTFLGSDFEDEGHDILFKGGNLYIAGLSYNSWGQPLNPPRGDAEGFIAKFSLDTPSPLILIHGWQGLAEGYHCSDDNNGANDIQRYDGTNSTLRSTAGYGDMADWFAQLGYDVWIAHWETSKAGGTPALVNAGKCLRDQINYVGESTRQPLTIVAYSMGGQITRAAIKDLAPGVLIREVYTMGTPHAGFPVDYLPILSSIDPEGDICAHDRAACNELSPFIAKHFNPKHPNIEGIRYNFIGGDVSADSLPKNFCWLFWALEGEHSDCFPGSYSTVGWQDFKGVFVPADWPSRSMPGQYWTDDTHSENYDPANNYYSGTSANPDSRSDAFECIRALIEYRIGNTTDCDPAVKGPPVIMASLAYTQPVVGHLTASGLRSATAATLLSIEESLSMEVDTTASTTFALTYTGSTTPVFTLTRPDTQLIDPDYAALHPDEVSYENIAGSPELPPYVIYKFSVTQPGTWQLNISSSEEMDFKVLGIMETHRQLAVQTDADVYQMGDVATITAQLENNGVGIPGATVTVRLIRPDGIEEMLSLAEQGNGIYMASYVIPAAPGYLRLETNASGSDAGVHFTREKQLVVAIVPNDLQLTGNYGETPVDDNNDAQYEALNFTAEINVLAAGRYAVTADLYAGTQPVVHASKFLNLTTGTQIIILPFDGTTIRKAGLMGPYTITHLAITPLETGIPDEDIEDVFTTVEYSYTQFGTQSISGNAGVGGAMLTYYNNGVIRTVVADEIGNYSLPVSYNWSGTVIPSKAGYLFTPESTSYIGVTENQTYQLYVARVGSQPTFTPTSTLTFTPTSTSTSTPTYTPTFTATNTPTSTSTPTFTPTASPTASATYTPSDDVPDTREAVTETSPQDANLRYFISPDGDEDWLRFRVTRSGSLQVHLTSLPANYDLFVYNPDGQLLGSSTKDKKSAEFVGLTGVLPGNYYVRIVGVDGAWDAANPYQLRFSVPGKK